MVRRVLDSELPRVPQEVLIALSAKFDVVPLVQQARRPLTTLTLTLTAGTSTSNPQPQTLDYPIQTSSNPVLEREVCFGKCLPITPGRGTRGVDGFSG